MSKLEETNMEIECWVKLEEAGLDIDNTVIRIMLADIAKSLAMIADKLCGTEKDDKECYH